MAQVTVGSGDHHVLALHGWFGSARGWGALPDFLDGDTYTYVFMNLRGYGDRGDVSGEFTTEEAAADAIALADELGWDRFSLIGHSMGGKIIQHILLDAPEPPYSSTGSLAIRWRTRRSRRSVRTCPRGARPISPARSRAIPHR
jgi:pimeloyl-ACP methyl ester carboxylesterase